MSIEKGPTEESVQPTESITGELSQDEADATAGGHKPLDGGEGRFGGEGGEGGKGNGLKYF